MDQLRCRLACWTALFGQLNPSYVLVIFQSENKFSTSFFCLFLCFCFLFLAGPKDLLSDRCILSCPSMDLVTCLLDFRLNFASNRSIVPRLAASLAACAQLSALGRSSLKN